MSLWRKRNVKHNEQKHDNLSNPLDRLHQENVRLGLYEIVYDLSIKSDNLSIESDDLSIKSWIGLTDDERNEILGSDKPSYERHISNMIEAKLKEKNT
jgi:hypothetical protein